jgi:glyoxylase-like metal-dependent hydrolase (beta-lactamase superfamily II)
MRHSLTQAKGVFNMFTRKQPSLQSITPYIPLHYQHFSVRSFCEGEAEILPMWSGEGNLSYLVLNRESRDAFLIDPDLEILGSYLLTLDKENLRLVAVIDTHNHAEHATAAPALKQLLNVPYIMYENASSSFVTDRVGDQSERTIAGITVQFLHTPGHTPDMMTLQIGKHLFTGDSLFNLSCGRTDLPGGDAGKQYQSIHQIAQFPGEFTVHPGHDYNHQLSITIEEANTLNKRLQIPSQPEFVSLMKTHYANEEKPDDLAYYVAFNAR